MQNSKKFDLITKAETLEDLKGREVLTYSACDFNGNPYAYYYYSNEERQGDKIYYSPKTHKVAVSFDGKVLEETFKGKYFALSDSDYFRLDGREAHFVFCWVSWDDKEKAIRIIFSIINRKSFQMEEAGRAYFNNKKGLYNCTSLNGHRFGVARNRYSMWKICIDNEEYQTYTYREGVGGRILSLEAEVSNYYQLDNSTGLVFDMEYFSVNWKRANLLDPICEASITERASARGPIETGYRSCLDRDVTLDISEYHIDTVVEMSIQNQLKTLLDEKFESPFFRSGERFCRSYVMALCSDPKGYKSRRSVGILYCGLRSGDIYEMFPFCYAKVSANGSLKDYYIRASVDNKWHRICGHALKKFKEEISGYEVIKATLQSALNLRNKNLVAALVDDNCEAVDMATVARGAAMRHGSTFCEQLLKTNHTALANSIIDKLSDHCNWNIYHTLGDLIPGADDENQTSIYKALGVSKAWAKYALQRVEQHDNEDTTTTWRDLNNVMVAINLTIAAGQSPQTPSADAMKNVDDIVKFREDGVWKDAFNLTYGNDAKKALAIIKQYGRMIRKIAETTDNDATCLQYYTELFWKYVEIQTINMKPEDYNLFVEFGLPDGKPHVNTDGKWWVDDQNTEVEAKAGDTYHKESGFWTITRADGTDISTAVLVKSAKDSAIDMMHRRSDQASAVYHTYESKVNAEKNKKTEGLFRKTKLKYNGLGSKDGETFGEEGLVVSIPSRIYDETDNRSVEHEGARMHHCVFNVYSQQIAAGDYKIVYFRHKQDDVYMTVGISKDNIINQTYLAYDHHPAKKDLIAVKQWVDSRNGLVKLPENGRPAGSDYDLRTL